LSPVDFVSSAARSAHRFEISLDDRPRTDIQNEFEGGPVKPLQPKIEHHRQKNVNARVRGILYRPCVRERRAWTDNRNDSRQNDSEQHGTSFHSRLRPFSARIGNADPGPTGGFGRGRLREVLNCGHASGQADHEIDS
jgi:hypothetical protein